MSANKKLRNPGFLTLVNSPYSDKVTLISVFIFKTNIKVNYYNM